MAIGEMNAGGHLEWSPMLTGARGYGANGGHSATRGPVDKTGYRERDLRNAQRQAILARLAALNGSGTLGAGPVGSGGVMR